MNIPNKSLILRPDGSVWWASNLPDHVDGLELTSPPLIRRWKEDGTTVDQTLWEPGCTILDCTEVPTEHFAELLRDATTLRVREVEGKIKFLQVLQLESGEKIEIEHPAETKQKAILEAKKGKELDNPLIDVVSKKD